MVPVMPWAWAFVDEFTEGLIGYGLQNQQCNPGAQISGLLQAEPCLLHFIGISSLT